MLGEFPCIINIYVIWHKYTHTHTHTRNTFLAPPLRCTNGSWSNAYNYYNLSSYNKHTSEKITTDQNIVYKDIFNKTYTYLYGNIIYLVWRTSTSGGLPTRVFDIYLSRYYTVGFAKMGKNVLYHYLWRSKSIYDTYLR